MKIEEIHSIFLKSNGVSTDTRKITKGSIFFALKGDNFDGNAFAQQAIENGATYAIIDNDNYKNKNTIVVEDTLETLQKLAHYHRKKLNTKIISLTGSNGKTTTKELINAVLNTTYKTIATIGNLNNHIGVPLTLLRLTNETEIGIIEMGANHQKEIEALCKIAEPDYGYITNFGKAHLEGFGGVEGVIKGKSELYDFLLKENKTIFYNQDDTIQVEKIGTHTHSFSFSTQQNQDAETQITQLESENFLKIAYNNISINTHLIGYYNLNNIGAAICIGNFFNVAENKIKEGLENYIPSNNRSQIIQQNNYNIILDAYNANPSSMQVALDNFSKIKNTHKLAVLGDMFELGTEAHKEHQNIAEYALKLGLNTILIGANFYQTKNNFLKFESFDDFKEFLKKEKINQTHLLIKGSRGMALERTLQYL